MKFTHFFEVLLQQFLFFIVTGLMGLSMQALKQQQLTEFFWRNNVYNPNSSEETR